MDQSTFQKLKQQAKINIIGSHINETQYRVLPALEQSVENFDVLYNIDKVNGKLLVTTTAKNPLIIESAEVQFSLNSFNKAFAILYENRDLVAINIPCNTRITLSDDSNPVLFDVSFTLSVQDMELMIEGKTETLKSAPIGMLTFMTESGDRYFINAQINQLLAHIMQLKSQLTE